MHEVEGVVVMLDMNNIGKSLLGFLIRIVFRLFSIIFVWREHG